MSLYDTLGVPSDASDDEIKAAYRKKAMVVHPDRGGETEEAQAVNHAYEVLSDSERRKRYDETGDDRQDRRVPEELAENGLRQFFDSFFSAESEIDTVDPVKRVTASLKTSKVQGQQQIASAEKAIKKYEKALKRAKRKSEGTNIITAVLDAKISQETARIAELRRQCQCVDVMLGMLEDYEYEVDLPTQQQAAEMRYRSPFVVGGIFGGLGV